MTYEYNDVVQASVTAGTLPGEIHMAGVAVDTDDYDLTALCWTIVLPRDLI